MTCDAAYQGMRWFKCDLHMHTPADTGHWRGAPLGDDPRRTAEIYMRRCYEAGLEVVAITDHNFGGKEFIPHLKRAIRPLAREFGYEITLFPGFEICADVGRGIHVLCLFAPQADLEDIDHLLTSCGVPRPRQTSGGAHRPSTSRLDEILPVVQKRNADGYLLGLVICPHPHDIGIFDSQRVAEWLQQNEWKNNDLLAVEVPKPVEQMSEGWRHLFANDATCLTEWKRIRPMAPVVSSDAKALTERENPENYIGKRYCWIKMSNPSVEALRQAFLDHESRICLQPTAPSPIHTYVKCVETQGNAFLADQQVALSPNLNCIIGGRGSGKSLLFESLRLGLRAEVSADRGAAHDPAAKQVERLRRTMASNGSIRLVVAHGGIEDRFLVEGSSVAARVEGREVGDAEAVFRQVGALFFSQEEITELAERQDSLIDFLDDLGIARLEPHRASARGTVDTLKAGYQTAEVLERLESELTTLRQEAIELARELEAKSQVQEELKRHRAAQQAGRYVDGLIEASHESEQEIRDAAIAIKGDLPKSPIYATEPPERPFLDEAGQALDSAYSQLATTLVSAAETLHKVVESAVTQHPALRRLRSAIVEAEQRFQQACDERGLSPVEAERLQETESRLRTKEKEIEDKEKQIALAQQQLPNLPQLLETLAGCWVAETNARQEVLADVLSSSTMPRTAQDEPIIRASIEFSGNREEFLALWETLTPDRRSAAGRVWSKDSRDDTQGTIGDELFEAFQNARNDPSAGAVFGNPLQWLEHNLVTPSHLPPLVRAHRTAILEVRTNKREAWLNLLFTRVSDFADIVLLRSDGSEAGSFDAGDLSDGQKNTAILSLLLARGGGPVFIDQPEDELDSEFLYDELVPLIRHAKRQRQLVIVTHNANLPVNGDAELVYALTAERGKGICRAQGGLDRAEVTRAVLDIMEGSEEAFRRRQEKYRF